MPHAQLALLGDKSGLTAMNTDSLLMCYNLFWFAAQHSPSASSHSNANDDDDDGEAEDEDVTIEIVNPIGIEYPQNSIMTTDTLCITQKELILNWERGVVWPHKHFALLIFQEISSQPYSEVLRYFIKGGSGLYLISARAAKYAKYAYLGAPNMVKWGVPEKILQNAVQTR